MNNGGTFEQIKTNTKAMNLFGENSMMLVSYSDDTMFIDFRDKVIQPDGRSKYPNTKLNIAIKPDIAYGLYIAFTTKFIDKLKEGVPFSIGLFNDFNKTTFIQFYTGDDGHTPTIQFIANANTQSKLVCDHVFRKYTVLENWEKSNVSESVDYPGLYLFVKSLELFGEHLNSSGVAHSIRKANAWANSNNYKLLCDIALKLGVNISNSYAGQSPSYNNSPSSYNQAPKTETANSMDALMGSDDLPF